MSTFAIPGRGENREDVEYGRAGQISLRLDMHLPKSVAPTAAIILVHGGAWVTGDRKLNVAPLLKPLSDAGFAWFSISYRLANDLPSTRAGGQIVTSLLNMGTAVDDVRQAVAFVKENASAFHVDPDRIALVGESAGAQLASMAALKPGPEGAVQAVVAFYCPSDLVNLAQNLKQVPDSIRNSIRGTVWETMLNGTLRQFSPLTWVSKDSPPFLLIHGTADTLVPFAESTVFCKAINDAGSQCDLYCVEGGGHGMRWWESARLTAYKPFLVNWLRARLAPNPASPVSAHGLSAGESAADRL